MIESSGASPSPLVREEPEPDRDTIRTIGEGLDAHNLAVVGYDDYAPLWLVARDGGGTVMGGLKAHTGWSWLTVDWLWVAEAQRRRGLGSRMLARAEAIARERGCTDATLDTFSFQAPDFYRRHGYEEFGRLDGLPPGHARIWFRKTLQGRRAAPDPWL